MPPISSPCRGLSLRQKSILDFLAKDNKSGNGYPRLFFNEVALHGLYIILHKYIFLLFCRSAFRTYTAVNLTTFKGKK